NNLNDVGSHYPEFLFRTFQQVLDEFWNFSVERLSCLLLIVRYKEKLLSPHCFRDQVHLPAQFPPFWNSIALSSCETKKYLFFVVYPSSKWQKGMNFENL
ncbi:hypothetical protein WUBG_17774, partial [Wuchereria bancrofti]